jgi:FkbM family methyltransferase
MVGLVARKVRTASVRILTRFDPYHGAQVDWAIRVHQRQIDRILIDALVEGGSVVVDLGAHRGMFTARLQHLVGSGGRVYAFEPVPDHERRLATLACRGNLDYRIAAASSTAGWMTLYIPVVEGIEQQGLASSNANPLAHNRHIDVRVETVDEVLSDEPRPISFMKIDVEGHEREVLAGAQRTLKALPTLFIEVEQRHHVEPISEVFDDLSRLGYDGWGIYPDGLRPLADFDLDRDQLRFLTRTFQNVMPSDYVNDFLFLPRGHAPPNLS